MERSSEADKLVLLVATSCAGVALFLSCICFLLLLSKGGDKMQSVSGVASFLMSHVVLTALPLLMHSLIRFIRNIHNSSIAHSLSGWQHMHISSFLVFHLIITQCNWWPSCIYTVNILIHACKLHGKLKRLHNYCVYTHLDRSETMMWMDMGCTAHAIHNVGLRSTWSCTWIVHGPQSGSMHTCIVPKIWKRLSVCLMIQCSVQEV